MNNLQIKQQTLDSREVAEMVEKEHKNLLADIRKYEEFLTGSNLSPLEFFSKSTYIDTKGEERPNYQVTKKGCEFIAHKLTGQKGAIFTAKYINRFHDMETSLNQAVTMLSEEQRLQLAIFQAKTSSEAVQASANLDRYRQRQLEEKQKQLEYKTEVLKGITEDIDIYTKRNVLNKVVRYKKANYSLRWNELYERFKEVYSIDLKARCEGYNLKQEKKKDKLSTIKYAEKFGHLDNLYRVAVKLYETDVKEILEQLKGIA